MCTWVDRPNTYILDETSERIVCVCVTIRNANNKTVTTSKTMSVFSDFQRMWVQRFPQSSLSDAWEQDVRASLERHKQKITDLTRELEQETLYVEYLERLLSDVEKYRESGGDAANPIPIPSDTQHLDKTKEVSEVTIFFLSYSFGFFFVLRVLCNCSVYCK